MTAEYWTPLEAWKERAKTAEAEIERLTKERDEALRHGVEIRDDWLRGVAEIERLTENNWPFEWQVATAEREKRKAAEAEIERLTSELVETRDALEVTRGAISNLMDEIERLRAVAEVAVEVVRDWADPNQEKESESFFQAVARLTATLAALDPEPPTRAGVKLEDAYRGLER